MIVEVRPASHPREHRRRCGDEIAEVVLSHEQRIEPRRLGVVEVLEDVAMAFGLCGAYTSAGVSTVVAESQQPKFHGQMFIQTVSFCQP